MFKKTNVAIDQIDQRNSQPIQSNDIPRQSRADSRPSPPEARGAPAGREDHEGAWACETRSTWELIDRVLLISGIVEPEDECGPSQPGAHPFTAPALPPARMRRRPCRPRVQRSARP